MVRDMAYSEKCGTRLGIWYMVGNSTHGMEPWNSFTFSQNLLGIFERINVRLNKQIYVLLPIINVFIFLNEVKSNLNKCPE